MATLITDLTCYLDSRGELPSDLPGPALNLALYLGAFVAWATRGGSSEPERTNVPCRRRPRGRRCSGEIVAALFADAGEVERAGPACGERGVISGWRGTRWDRSRGRR
jgi:hypothetical protein